MAAPYVTGAAILTHVGKTAPTAAETAWAGVCADAIEAMIALRLDGATPSAGFEDELIRAALQDGAAAFMDKSAPHGVESLGPDGEVVRLGRDLNRALYPVFQRHLGPGIG